MDAMKSTVMEKPWIIVPVLVVVYMLMKPRGLSVKDKLVLITGGSQGIGLAVARVLVDKGAHVILLARNKEKLNEAKSSLEKGKAGKVHVYPCDCSNTKDVDRVCKLIKEDLSVPDVSGANTFSMCCVCDIPYMYT